MLSCRICLEELKRPACLPCGHIFCSDCIVKTVKAVKPYTHMQPCPICRSLYNVAPINLNVVPPNLRQFITPSIRRLYLDDIPPQEANDAKHLPESLSSSSELSRLRTENIALRNNCAMWRKRAEVHGAANLNLLNFVRAIRDQATTLSRERQQLEQHCRVLKRKIEDDQLSLCFLIDRGDASWLTSCVNRISRSERALEELFRNNAASIQGPEVPDLLADSLLFAPPTFQGLPERSSPGQAQTPQRRTPIDNLSCLPSDRVDPERTVKRMKIEHLVTS